MEQFFAMLGVQTTLFLYISVGYYFRKREILTRPVRKALTHVVLNALLPCMVFNSFQQDISLERLISAGAMLAAALGMCLFSWGFGKLIWRRVPIDRQKIMRYGTMIPNSGVSGLPVIGGVYGAEGLFLAAIYIIPYRVLMWTAGVSVFTKSDRQSFVKNVLLNPGILSVVIGLVWMLLRLPLPGFVSRALDGMGQATSPMAMILVGAILGDVSPREVILDRDAWLAALVRLIGMPLINFFVLRAIGFSTLGTAIATLLSGMPIASSTAMLAERYDADAVFASKCVFASTLLNLITIPLLTLLFP